MGGPAAKGALSSEIREANQADEQEQAAICGRLLQAHGWRAAVAESCTGGLVGHLLTEIAGSSAWFLGGVIAYADSVKIGTLGVPEAVIREHGAVSAPCAAAMAEGARRVTGAEVGVAITGIAGPSGGTPAKPVGTVYLAVATPTGTTTAHHVWPGTRSANKQESARTALGLLRALLEKG